MLAIKAFRAREWLGVFCLVVLSAVFAQGAAHEIIVSALVSAVEAAGR